MTIRNYIQLAELFEVKNGYAFKSKEQVSNPTDNALEILKQGHIAVGGGLRKSPKKFYIPYEVKLHKYLLEKGDIVMAMTDMKDNAGILGIPAIVDASNKYVVNQRVGWLKPKQGVVTKFFYYQMLFKDFLEALRSKAHSGVQVNLSTSAIKKMSFWYPSIEEQQAIADVLSSFDDKIDLLHRQNQTLENIAQTLFRQWFIEEAKKTWALGTLDDILSVKVGTTPSTKNPHFWHGNIHWTSPKDITTHKRMYLFDTEKKITPEGLQKISSGVLPAGTLIMSSRVPVGILAFTAIPLAINQSYIAILDNKGIDKRFLYLWLKVNIDYVKSHANGSTFLAISKSAFKMLKVTIPPKAMITKFLTLSVPLFDKIKNNEMQMTTLANLRDTLLPKLMRGDIRVQP